MRRAIEGFIVYVFVSTALVLILGGIIWVAANLWSMLK